MHALATDNKERQFRARIKDDTGILSLGECCCTYLCIRIFFLLSFLKLGCPLEMLVTCSDIYHACLPSLITITPNAAEPMAQHVCKTGIEMMLLALLAINAAPLGIAMSCSLDAALARCFTAGKRPAPGADAAGVKRVRVQAPEKARPVRQQGAPPGAEASSKTRPREVGGPSAGAASCAVRREPVLATGHRAGLRRGLACLTLFSQLVPYAAGLGCSNVVNGNLFVAASVKIIGSYSFGNCGALKTVTFAANSALELIGFQAFTNSGLTSITIPASAKTIAGGAFASCKALTTVTFEANSALGAIGDSVFAGSGLTSITIPASVTSIERYAFYLCSALTTVTFKDNAALETIRVSAFFDSGLTSITIPTSLKSIASNAFASCKALTTMTFEANSALETIEMNAFSGSGLTSITIPASVKSLERYAFSSCSALTTVTYACSSAPLSVEPDAFMSTPYLTSGRAVPASTCRYIQFLVGCSDVVNGDLFVAASVRSIVNQAFSGCSALTTVTFEANSVLETIGDNAFYGSGLSLITIPASVKRIATYAFSDCSALTTVTFEGNSALETIGEYAFTSSGLTSITIPASVKNIALGFASCSTLTTVTFEGNAALETIGVAAFSGSGLTSITIPASVKSIENEAFQSCSALTTVTFEGNAALETIGDQAFLSSGLTAIAIPASVKSIASNAFASCSALTTVTYACSSAPLSVEPGAFKSTPYLTNGRAVPVSTCRDIQFLVGCSDVVNGDLFVAASVKSIASNTFYYCDALKTLTFEANSALESIESNAFSESGLTAIELPASLLTIGDYAFSSREDFGFGFGCPPEICEQCGDCKINLTVTFEANSKLRSIGAHAFSGSGLTSITIPASVKSIANGAFYSCGALTTVTFEADAALETIGDSAFSDSGLTSITIPASVKSIAGYAFAFGALTSLTFESNSTLETIADGAFYGSGIISITIPASVKTIGNDAFSNCGALTTVTYACSSALLSEGLDAFMSTPYLTNGRTMPLSTCRVIQFA